MDFSTIKIYSILQLLQFLCKHVSKFQKESYSKKNWYLWHPHNKKKNIFCYLKIYYLVQESHTALLSLGQKVKIDSGIQIVIILNTVIAQPIEILSMVVLICSNIPTSKSYSCQTLLFSFCHILLGSSESLGRLLCISPMSVRESWKKKKIWWETSNSDYLPLLLLTN